MLTVDEAQQRALQGLAPIGVERVSLDDALGRVLAEDIRTDLPMPPFSNSSMDGYAVIAADTLGASPADPIRLREIADIPAGPASQAIVHRGQAARVMTGAPVPEGADAIVIVENTERAGGWVLIRSEAQPGDHIRLAGEDVEAGAVILRVGDVTSSPALGALASVGEVKPLVHRRPRVALITTGDELVEPNVVPGFGQIRNSNRYLLSAACSDAGAEVSSIRHATDDLDGTKRTMAEIAVSCDVLITCGGVSMGDRDFVRDALGELGDVDFWRVAMKPGKPIVVGNIRSARVFGLPGNPVSALVTFELFVRPALRLLGGYRSPFRPTVRVRIREDVRPTRGRDEYVRVVIEPDGDELAATPTGPQESHRQKSMLYANGLLISPADTGLKAGQIASALLLTDCL